MPAGRSTAAYREKRGMHGGARAFYLKPIVDEAKSVPCVDCGVTYPPYVMDLDHRPGEEKVANVSALLRTSNGGREALLAEIAKCDPVCANCHRERTHKRLLEGKA